jgi:O-antigen ligase
MSSLDDRQVNAIRPLHVVMIVLVGMTLAGSSLLLSAAQSQILVDGAIEWHEESPLRAVVQLLCLNYQVPTIYAGTVKNYILGIGAGLAILCLTITIAAYRGNGANGRTLEVKPSPESETADVGTVPSGRKVHAAPLIAAQVLVGLYLLWSFASSRWSSAPELAVGASILLTIQFLWAFSIGNSLSASSVRIVCWILVGVTAVTSVVAIWYYYGRNPTLRAKFPYGNPTFLAACLIPGILLAISIIFQAVTRVLESRRMKHIGTALLSIGALGVTGWALYLTGARSSAVGLAFGLLGLMFFAVRGWRRILPIVMAFALSVVGWLYFAHAADASSPTGRNLTLRLRTYAWSYAWQMFRDRPLTGYGQGGFVLVGDSHAVKDVLDDPRVFESRIAHAHNEWLETLADLGLIGLVLLTAAVVLTFRAGMVTLRAGPPSGVQWVLLGLMGALFGLVVEASFGVGLRVAGVPTMFYTVLGLIWAASTYRMNGLTYHLSRTRGRRLAAAVVGGVAGLILLATVQQDFRAARHSHQADIAFFNGEYDRAIELASDAPNQLNPQRAMTDLYRLGEAHLRRGQRFQERARDRQRRAYETDIPDARLLALAQEDYQLSEASCQRGSHTLNQLIARAPGFMNHGRLAYWLYLTMAGNAAAQEDQETEKALVQNAAIAIKRELLRQPFEPTIAAYYARVSRYTAGADINMEELIEALARPLRHNRLTEVYMELLRELANDPAFERGLEPIVSGAKLAVSSPSAAVAPDDQIARWAPEVLRLAAALHFTAGRYDQARELLVLAAPVYDQLASAAPFGAASCLGELAICQFFADPRDPDAALASATRAIELAPESLSGRQLRQAVKERMVDYHLAAEREEQARQLLAETAPPGATEEDVLHQLGVRYRRMCEAMLGRREADGLLRKAPTDLLPSLTLWISRALALNPNDPLAHFVAADLAFYAGDDQATVDQLRQCLGTGLPVEEVARFLALALEKKPDSLPLQALWSTLTSPPVPGKKGDSD